MSQTLALFLSPVPYKTHATASGSAVLHAAEWLRASCALPRARDGASGRFAMPLFSFSVTAVIQARFLSVLCTLLSVCPIFGDGNRDFRVFRVFRPISVRNATCHRKYFRVFCV